MLGVGVGDPTRLRLLYELGDGPADVGTLATKVGVSSATVSHHVTKLLEIGLVHVRRVGRRTIVQRAYWRWRRLIQVFN